MEKERTLFKPFGDRIIFQEVYEEESALVLPDSAKENAKKKYIVLAVGPGRQQFVSSTGEFIRVPMEVKIGDRITLTNQGAAAVSAHNLDGSKDEKDVLFSISESYIAGIVE